jgi:hypothetical protein
VISSQDIQSLANLHLFTETGKQLKTLFRFRLENVTNEEENVTRSRMQASLKSIRTRRFPTDKRGRKSAVADGFL